MLETVDNQPFWQGDDKCFFANFSQDSKGWDVAIPDLSINKKCHGNHSVKYQICTMYYFFKAVTSKKASFLLPQTSPPCSVCYMYLPSPCLFSLFMGIPCSFPN